MKINELEEIIQFALEKEEEAVSFYHQCSELTAQSNMKEAFIEMAEEEEKHVQMLQKFKPEKVQAVVIKNIPNLKISDYIVDMKFDPKMGYKDLLILAMKREEKSVELYSELATKGKQAELVKLFQFLAQEELKHKFRLEKEYDEVVLRDN